METNGSLWWVVCAYILAAAKLGIVFALVAGAL